MGFFSKITKPFKKAANKVIKPFQKVSDKLIPNELRPLLPYAFYVFTSVWYYGSTRWFRWIW